MVEYVDKAGVKYPTFWDFKQAHPELVCGGEPTKELLGLLELSTREVPTPEPDIEATRAYALEDLNRRFLEFRQNKAKVKSSLGFVADATERALVDVSGLVAITEASEDPIVFMDAENQPHELTHDQLVGLRKEIALNGSAVYGTKWKYRAKILSAKTTQEIEAINVRFENDVE